MSYTVWIFRSAQGERLDFTKLEEALSIAEEATQNPTLTGYLVLSSTGEVLAHWSRP
jgi:hypothetical protein